MTANEHKSGKPDAEKPRSLLTIWGPAYQLTARGKRVVGAIETVFWLVLLIAMLLGMLELISLGVTSLIIVGAIVIRLVCLAIYLTVANEPTVQMSVRQKLDVAVGSMPAGTIEGSVRTLSIVSVLGFIIVLAMILWHGQLFTSLGLLVVCGLALLAAGAVALEVLLHRMAAHRRADS